MIAMARTPVTDRFSDAPESDEDTLLYRGAVRRLRSTGYRLLDQLDCEVVDGVVTLLGVVPSFFLKQLAQEAVLPLNHVREVKNLVEVRREESLIAAGLSGVQGNS